MTLHSSTFSARSSDPNAYPLLHREARRLRTGQQGAVASTTSAFFSASFLLPSMLLVFGPPMIDDAAAAAPVLTRPAVDSCAHRNERNKTLGLPVLYLVRPSLPHPASDGDQRLSVARTSGEGFDGDGSARQTKVDLPGNKRCRTGCPRHFSCRHMEKLAPTMTCAAPRFSLGAESGRLTRQASTPSRSPFSLPGCHCGLLFNPDIRPLHPGRRRGANRAGEERRAVFLRRRERRTVMASRRPLSQGETRLGTNLSRHAHSRSRLLHRSSKASKASKAAWSRICATRTQARHLW